MAPLLLYGVPQGSTSEFMVCASYFSISNCFFLLIILIIMSDTI